MKRLKPNEDGGACRHLPRDEALRAAGCQLDAAKRLAIGIRYFRAQFGAFAPCVRDIHGEHHIGCLRERSDMLFENTKLRHIAGWLLAVDARVDRVKRGLR